MMLKWLHRGLVGVLLAVAVGAGVASIASDKTHIHLLRIGDYPVQYLSVDFSMGGLSIWGASPLAKHEGRGRRTYKRFAGVQYVYAESSEYTAAESLWDSAFGSHRNRRCTYSVRVNLPLIAILAAAYPCFFFYRTYRRRRGRPANACANCSYDLTGNESGVCPECGTTAAVRDKAEGAATT